MDFDNRQELTEEAKVLLREKQSEINRILEALEGLEKNKDWKTLRETLFGKSLEAIERQIKNEALSPEINSEKLYKLQGEWVWAKQFMDIPAFIQSLKRELEAIKLKIK